MSRFLPELLAQELSHKITKEIALLFKLVVDNVTEEDHIFNFQSTRDLI
jgi:hypothetical protein